MDSNGRQFNPGIHLRAAYWPGGASITQTYWYQNLFVQCLVHVRWKERGILRNRARAFTSLVRSEYPGRPGPPDHTRGSPWAFSVSGWTISGSPEAGSKSRHL